MTQMQSGATSKENCRGQVDFPNIVALTRHRAYTQPTDPAYTFLKDGEVESGTLTYAALDSSARAIAVALRAYVEHGDRVALAFPHGLDFITAFFGCLYAGVVAVPVYPPTRQSDWPRFEAIATNAGARIVLTNAASMGGARMVSCGTLIASQNDFRYLAIEEMVQAPSHQWMDPAVHSDTLAFLQYTSGSTGTPKGVMVTHRNLLHNQRLIKQGFEHSSHTIVVGWLPLYHDMGLIGNVLQPLYLGVHSILMAPVAFVLKPLRWLQAISHYRATTSGGPNFAYDLCVRRVAEEQMEGVDLRSWEVAFNGSEKIRADTLARFADKFSSYGFRKSSFLCCYGLAESTLFVSGVRPAESQAIMAIDADALQEHRVVAAHDATTNAIDAVASGGVTDLQVYIVDPEKRVRCEPGRIGEIWVDGESVAEGYWNAPSASSATFGACLADTGEGPYLRTGDLGFINGGQLYITGRLKEMIIIRGRNYYPQDIEAVVQTIHPGMRQDSGAAFAIDIGGVESLVVVQEVSRTHSRNLDLGAITGAARFAVMSELGLPLHELVLLKQGGLPKTSSGKTRRSACRQAYLAGSLNILQAADKRGAHAVDAYEQSLS